MDQPNILWICTDQQRWDTLGCYGNSFVRTPNLDRLAAEGALFEHAYCQNPVCMPSRSSFLTGRYPHVTGCRGNGVSISDDELLVTYILSQAGYFCGLSGKLHLRPHGNDEAEPRGRDGYSEFHWSPNPWPAFPGDEYLHWLRERGAAYERKALQGSPYVESCVPGELSHSHWCAQQAVDFIEAAAGREAPWLFSVNFFDPHNTFDPPEEYLRAYLDRLDDIPLPNFDPEELTAKPAFHRRWYQEGKWTYYGHYPYPQMSARDHRLVRAAYWAMCDQIDREVGRMLDALERTGQAADTIVIFMADHGELLGDHGVYEKGAFLYDPSVRVPLIVRWPRGLPGGRRLASLVELVDLAPTLLEAAGLDVYAGMQGRSLRPLLTGEAEADHHRDDVYCEYLNSSGKPRGMPAIYATMLRTRTHKLIVHHGEELGELYDLAADPGERVNLWGEPGAAGTKLALMKRLCDRAALMADPLPHGGARSARLRRNFGDGFQYAEAWSR
jgi:arylsulfatase A-like enzyme